MCLFQNSCNSLKTLSKFEQKILARTSIVSLCPPGWFSLSSISSWWESLTNTLWTACISWPHDFDSSRVVLLQPLRHLCTCRESFAKWPVLSLLNNHIIPKASDLFPFFTVGKHFPLLTNFMFRPYRTSLLYRIYASSTLKSDIYSISQSFKFLFFIQVKCLL